jgi:signal transduction histidine kinase
MSRQPLHLETLVRDVVLGFDASLRHHDLSWRIEAADDSLVVVGDAGRLGQVVGNMVDNAIRYARAGSTISLTLTRRGESVRLAVRDVGQTIDDGSLPHIFERFFRADPSRARGSGGAGIGLAIVKELVAAHGGSVGAESHAARADTINRNAR